LRFVSPRVPTGLAKPRRDKHPLFPTPFFKVRFYPVIPAPVSHYEGKLRRESIRERKYQLP
jgi:hypothetical protein